MTSLIHHFLKFLSKNGVIDTALLFINKIGIHKFAVNEAKLRRVYDQCRPGDAIVVRALGEATTLFLLSGHFTHCALKVTEDNKIADATGKGVTERDILALFKTISDIGLVRPRLSEADRVAIAKAGEEYAKKRIAYDTSYGKSKKKMYCSEYYYHCHNDVSPHKLVLTKRVGFETITPDEIYNNTALMERIV